MPHKTVIFCVYLATSSFHAYFSIFPRHPISITAPLQALLGYQAHDR